VNSGLKTRHHEERAVGKEPCGAQLERVAVAEGGSGRSAGSGSIDQEGAEISPRLCSQGADPDHSRRALRFGVGDEIADEEQAIFRKVVGIGHTNAEVGEHVGAAGSHSSREWLFRDTNLV
jgi:hypothetical protein